MNYYERHLGDYAKDAGHLSMLEHGAYTMLLDRYYTTEQPIPADQAHRVCRARTKDEREAVDAVLAEFFTLENGAWVNRRAQAEVLKMQAKVKASQENGKLGGRPKRTQTEPTGNPPGFVQGTQDQSQQNLLQSPDTRHQKENPPTPRKRGKFDASAIELPDWLPRGVWEEWAKDRAARRKPITERGAARQVAQLAEYRKAGHSPEAVIAHSLAGGFQGLYPPPKVAGPVAVAAPTPDQGEAERRAQDEAWRNRTPEQIEAARAAKLAALSAVRRIA